MAKRPSTVGRRLGAAVPGSHRLAFFLWYTLPLLAYLGLIGWVSHRPGGGTPWFPFPHADKVVHLIEYGPVGFLALRWLATRWPGTAWFALRGIVAAGLFGVTYGIVDEFHQSFVPGRHVDPLDVLADGCGSVIGGAAYAWIFLRRRR